MAEQDGSRLLLGPFHLINSLEKFLDLLHGASGNLTLGLTLVNFGHYLLLLLDVRRARLSLLFIHCFLLLFLWLRGSLVRLSLLLLFEHLLNLLILLLINLEILEEVGHVHGLSNHLEGLHLFFARVAGLRVRVLLAVTAVERHVVVVQLHDLTDEVEVEAW